MVLLARIIYFKTPVTALVVDGLYCMHVRASGVVTGLPLFSFSKLMYHHASMLIGPNTSDEHAGIVFCVRVHVQNARRLPKMLAGGHAQTRFASVLETSSRRHTLLDVHLCLFIANHDQHLLNSHSLVLPPP